MSRRDKMAGVVHTVEFLAVAVGFFGWLWFVTHRPIYHQCNCK